MMLGPGSGPVLISPSGRDIRNRQRAPGQGGDAGSGAEALELGADLHADIGARFEQGHAGWKLKRRSLCGRGRALA